MTADWDLITMTLNSGGALYRVNYQEEGRVECQPSTFTSFERIQSWSSRADYHSELRPGGSNRIVPGGSGTQNFRTLTMNDGIRRSRFPTSSRPPILPSLSDATAVDSAVNRNILIQIGTRAAVGRKRRLCSFE